VTNFLHKNYWRVQNHMEYQDAMQEAKLVFVRVKNKYGNLDTPKHFMSLFKTSWVREFHDLAIRDTAIREAECVMQSVDSDEDYIYDSVGETDNEGMLYIMIQQAPDEVKKVLKLFLITPIEVLYQMKFIWKWRGKKSEFDNQHLCEILKLKEGTDVIGKVVEYLTESTGINKNSNRKVVK
jgi:hypothetical protein